VEVPAKIPVERPDRIKLLLAGQTGRVARLPKDDPGAHPVGRISIGEVAEAVKPTLCVRNADLEED
jgi:hypothetical protein